MHGVNKSDADLKAAIQYAGTIVVDNLSELSRLASRFPISDSLISSRIFGCVCNPAWPSKHHAYTQTGQHDSKFGMDGEELMEAVLFCKDKGLPIDGIALPSRLPIS